MHTTTTTPRVLEISVPNSADAFRYWLEHIREHEEPDLDYLSAWDQFLLWVGMIFPGSNPFKPQPIERIRVNAPDGSFDVVNDDGEIRELLQPLLPVALTLTSTLRTSLTIAENRANINHIRNTKEPHVTEWDALLTILADATGQLDLVGQPAVTRFIIHAVDGDLVVVNRNGKITEVPAILANLEHVE